MSQRISITTTKALYKYLIRQTELLPADAKKFYRASIRRVRFFFPSGRYGKGVEVKSGYKTQFNS